MWLCAWWCVVVPLLVAAAVISHSELRQVEVFDFEKKTAHLI